MFLCRSYVHDLLPQLALRTSALTVVTVLRTIRTPVNVVDQKGELLTVASRLSALRQCCAPPPSQHYSMPSRPYTFRPLQTSSEAWIRVKGV